MLVVERLMSFRFHTTTTNITGAGIYLAYTDSLTVKIPCVHRKGREREAFCPCSLFYSGRDLELAAIYVCVYLACCSMCVFAWKSWDKASNVWSTPSSILVECGINCYKLWWYGGLCTRSSWLFLLPGSYVCILSVACMSVAWRMVLFRWLFLWRKAGICKNVMRTDECVLVGGIRFLSLSQSVVDHMVLLAIRSSSFLSILVRRLSLLFSCNLLLPSKFFPGYAPLWLIPLLLVLLLPALWLYSSK